jgi:exodeoxyribonuclease VII large subunit
MNPAFSFLAPALRDKPYSVSEINQGIAHIIESSNTSVCVEGEISNFKQASSGHCYLRLKDEQSIIPAVIWRSALSRFDFIPQDGMQVMAIAGIRVYQKGGYYQLDITRMKQSGAGALFAAFEKLKQKLEKEGLFDPAIKKPIPASVERLGVITSVSGAAVRDIIKVVRRRAPSTVIVLCDVQVQGEKAAGQIAAAIRDMNEYGRVDCIIAGRGGGSIEDLSAFNDERVARAIRSSRIPVISAVGHETDFTIADFAADARAPTPSAAAEMAVPDTEERRRLFLALSGRIVMLTRHIVSSARTRLDVLSARMQIKKPSRIIEESFQRIDDLRERQVLAINNRFSKSREQLRRLGSQLEALSPLSVLYRGYSVVTAPSGKVVKDASKLNPSDRIDIRFHSGTASAVIESTTRQKDGAQ